MILSMTGFGQARYEDDDIRIAVEVRAVNNRYLKVNLHGSEPVALLEAEVDRAVRQYLTRGTVNVSLRVDRTRSAGAYRLNVAVLSRYLAELTEFSQTHGLAPVRLPDVLPLPGVVEDQNRDEAFSPEEIGKIRRTLEEALARVNRMREQEGEAMARQLAGLCDDLAARVEAISARVPQVVRDYRDKILDRVRELLNELDVKIDQADLIREVSIFADRCDVTEELVRLRSHVDQFREVLQKGGTAGRKLDFVTQEMFREANTVGSKSLDVEIGRHVVDLKELVERLRELVQNVE